MRVRALDPQDDWTFGKGRANYLTGSNAIAQNVKTRLRSFKNDWYLNVNHGIDWIELLGNIGTERRILRAIEKTVLQTEGVISVSRVDITRRDKRDVTIEIDYKDAFTERSETLAL